MIINGEQLKSKKTRDMIIEQIRQIIQLETENLSGYEKVDLGFKIKRVRYYNG